MATDNELMDAVQAAEFLGVHIQTQRKLAKQKRIPAFKVGREWRFRKNR
jgi:excisionase family DNA binding protein